MDTLPGLTFNDNGPGVDSHSFHYLCLLVICPMFKLELGIHPYGGGQVACRLTQEAEVGSLRLVADSGDRWAHRNGDVSTLRLLSFLPILADPPTSALVDAHHRN